MKRSAGPEAGPPRLVIDTNVFVSALLFKGVASRLVPLWQSGRIVYLLSRPILEEYLRVLAYPKFSLTEREIKGLIEGDLLPYVETIQDPALRGIPYLKDPSDQKFLALAKTGKANYLLSGDKVLLEVKQIAQATILSPGDFLNEQGVNIWS